MSDKVFLDIVNMSITGSFAILIIILARLLLKKTPKVFSYALWFVAFFRLLVPVSFESVLSILPFNTTPLSTDMLYIETPYVETGIKAIDSVINPVVATEVFGSNANVYQIFTFWGKIIWFIGVFAFCLYSIRSYSKLKKKLQSAVLLRDNIYISQVISTPFALGLRNPKIYLPSNLTDAQEYVIAHEQTHLARRDNLAKILGYVVLILHWFNPLVWLAFKLFVTDMEMSCDESVIRNSKEDIRKEYSQSLLELIGLNDPTINVDNVVFHSLRHTSTGVKLRLSKGDLKAVQGDGGWNSPDMVTKRYAHILDEDRRRLADEMEQSFYKGKAEEAPVAAAPALDAEALASLLASNPELLKKALESVQLANNT